MHGEEEWQWDCRPSRRLRRRQTGGQHRSGITQLHDFNEFNLNLLVLVKLA